MKSSRWFLSLLVCIVVSCEQAPPGRLVTASDFGEEWPFTVEEGYLNCERGQCVIFLVNGKKYALNGTAKSNAQQQGYSEVEEIWKDHPTYEGLKVDIGTMISEGLKLCK